ncbi:MAG: hypothetical protein WCG25_06680 [bacterium]
MSGNLNDKLSSSWIISSLGVSGFFSILVSSKAFLISPNLNHLAFTTVIFGSYLSQACLTRFSRDVLIILSTLADLHLYQFIMSISNFLKSKTSLVNISILPDISSTFIKNHFFFAL